MELILQTGLEHQQRAVDAVADVLQDVHIEQPSQFYENPCIDLTDVNILSNIREIQGRKELSVHNIYRKPVRPEISLNLDIKMETGTGKTYVYTHTIYELHKRYGINKFVVVVPTLPIKAGAKAFMSDPYVLRHFKDTCGYGADIELCVATEMKQKKGKKFFPSSVRAFVDGSHHNRNKIYVLLANMSLLTNAKVLSRNDYDYGVLGFYRPFDAIKETKPFVIIDEPHRFDKSQKAYKTIVDELKPQCIIRYGATFPITTTGRGRNKVESKDYDNLLYDLNACNSFNQNLIKGVAKEHFEPESGRNEKIKITSIDSKESVNIKHISSTTNRTYTLRTNDSLGVISEDLSGLTIVAIGKNYIELSNGQTKMQGDEMEVSVYSESFQEQMLKLALQRHFEVERMNFNRSIKIKTLALFFIDNIESYRGRRGEDEQGWLKLMFDRLLTEQIDHELSKTNSAEYKAYLEASKANIEACSAAYFAQDNNDSDEEVAKEVDAILHNKKELLSFRTKEGAINTRRFIFSKWTLKEGWDNPNVFTIAKLRSSGSENSKLQEVGRGLRLPVDEYGNRISNEEFMLNYIVDFEERDFADKLVAQINGDVPQENMMAITNELLDKVALLRGMDSTDLFIELLSKRYIDRDKNIRSETLSDFYNEYPEFNVAGVSKTKVIDRNKNVKNTVKIRSAQFEELKELWSQINKRYVLFYDTEVNKLIEDELPALISTDVFGAQSISSERVVLATTGNHAELQASSGVQYTVDGRKIPYNEFLTRINKVTGIPVKLVHKAICKYAESNPFQKDYINESTLTRFVAKFSDWKCDHLQGNLNYRKTSHSSKQTALTGEDGKPLLEINQGRIGVKMDNGIVSSKYLYDTIAYDSDLERKNILAGDIDEVVVYGKIPRRSIQIPTIVNETYSPDFMYVVKRSDGEKELNIIIETKDVEGKTSLRKTEETKINCAKKFFEQLKIDGYTVQFKTQLNNKEIKTIIDELK